MICPKCSKNEVDEVLTTRTAAKGVGVRRYRKCNACKFRWPTMELPVSVLTALIPHALETRVKEIAESYCKVKDAISST